MTGACGKLGPVWVGALLEAGARVAALDLPSAQASAPYADLAARWPDAVVRVDCDITQRASIDDAAQAVVSRLGTPAVLVNNAGIDQPPDSPGGRHELADLPIDTFRRMVEVNLLGTFQVTQVFGALMAAGTGGSIINIGSLYASVSPDPALLRSPGGQCPVHQIARVRRLEGWRRQPVEVLRHSLGGRRRAREHAVAGRRPGRTGRSVQGEVRCARTDAADGRGRGPEGAADIPGVRSFVLRDGPRATGRRRVHGVVSASNDLSRIPDVVPNLVGGKDQRPRTAARSARSIRPRAGRSARLRGRAPPTSRARWRARKPRSRRGPRSRRCAAATSCARSRS